MPLDWYNNFWLQYFPPNYNDNAPNSGHEALAQLASMDMGSGVENSKNNVRIITQNVDGLHSRTLCEWDDANKLIEAHGRIGLYKCIPEEDSDTDSDSDVEEDRPVKLGSRRKYRTALKTYFEGREPSSVEAWTGICPFEICQSISTDKLLPLSAREALCSDSSDSERRTSVNTAAEKNIDNKPTKKQQQHLQSRKPHLRLDTPPLCPSCSRPCLPQALLFDEGYHSHSFYQFEKMEEWIANYADVMVFVGTSFSVTITDVAVRYAMEKSIPVYNFNLHERLSSNARLNVENIMGDSSETLVELLSLVESIRFNRVQHHE